MSPENTREIKRLLNCAGEKTTVLHVFVLVTWQMLACSIELLAGWVLRIAAGDVNDEQGLPEGFRIRV